MKAVNPNDIAIRRMERFFGSADRPDYGICAHFERIGDRLWQADEIARALADRVPGGYRAVIERFRFSVKAGRFGPPASNGRFAAPEALRYDQRSRAETSRNLIDLDSAVLLKPEPGQYAIRPSVLIAADVCAPYMRARRSIWAQWIAAQGWPVPPELGAPVIEDKLAVAKPSQAELNKALLDFATRLGGKVKRGDPAALEMLKGLGATTRQITTAFRELPGQYRYSRGKPVKSGT